MSKAPRFPVRIDAWVSEDLANAVELLATHQEVTASSIVRQALKFYLGSIGALPQTRAPQPNGQSQGEFSHGR